MQEIEIKILDVDVKDLEKKLTNLGAVLVGKYNIISVIFDTKTKEIYKKKELLRLRKKNEEVYLTYKSNVKEGKTKTCEETEIKVSDFGAAMKMLQFLGLQPSKPVEKKRITYKLNNSLIEIDLYKEIPPFFEIESPNEKELEEIVHLLGFLMDDAKSWNGWEVFRHYGKKLEG